jgi:diguanylate cyclase (GGDEF)-like protein
MKLFAAISRIADRLPLLQRGNTNDAVIRQLELALEEKERLLQVQAAALAHSQKIFERSSKVARIGVWECSLPDNGLVWTDMVYELFDLPRDAKLDRAEILNFYSEDSLAELGRLRSKAIEERGGFSLDAEIVTAKGNRRWIRLTATVECENDIPVRIFGMKLDITAEKMMFDQIRYLAEFDTLTGLPNRAQFQSALQRLSLSYFNGACPAALLLIDLDGFKGINDTFGHQTGDSSLKEAAERLQMACQGAELVARIGGDEFAVLVSDYGSVDAVADLARRVVQCLSRSVERGGYRINVGASVGVALFDGSAPSDIFAKADAALYEAKTAGKSCFRTYAPSANVASSKMDAA